MRYSLLLLLGKEETYAGKLTVTFTAHNLKLQGLFLDFHGVKVAEVIINKQPVPIQFSNHRVQLQRKYLREGEQNEVEVKFENEYVHNSAGLHKFVDPVDGRTYLYTHLEPFFCHRWFPCFDQPSIRAPLRLKVATPLADWKVFANDQVSQAFKMNSHIAQSLID